MWGIDCRRCEIIATTLRATAANKRYFAPEVARPKNGNMNKFARFFFFFHSILWLCLNGLRPFFFHRLLVCQINAWKWKKKQMEKWKVECRLFFALAVLRGAVALAKSSPFTNYVWAILFFLQLFSSAPYMRIRCMRLTAVPLQQQQQQRSTEWTRSRNY